MIDGFRGNMSISFVIDGISNSGGTDRVLSMLSNLFSSKGVNVTVYSLNDGDPYYNLYEKVTLKKYGSFNRVSGLIKIISEIKKSNDKVIVISMGKLSVQYIMLSKLMMAGNEVFCSDHVGIKSFSVPIKFLKILCYSFYKKIITLTESDRIYLSSMPLLSPSKVFSIKNMSPYPSIDKSNLKFSLREKLAIGVGRFSDQKNFLRLLKIWKESQTEGWKLLLIGDGPERQRLEEFIKANKLENVELCSSTKEIDSYYQRASCLLMTSKYEGLPMVLIEAKSFGLPVIAFDCPSGPAELIDGDGFLIDYYNDESYIQHLNLLISNESLKNTLSYIAVDNSAKYSENQIYSSWCDVINDERK